MKNEEFLEIIVESLLYAASPDFGVTEVRPEEEYLAVLRLLSNSNPDEFEAMKLNNIQLFIDEVSLESTFLSSIIQLLGDKLKTTDISDVDVAMASESTTEE